MKPSLTSAVNRLSCRTDSSTLNGVPHTATTDLLCSEPAVNRAPMSSFGDSRVANAIVGKSSRLSWVRMS